MSTCRPWGAARKDWKKPLHGIFPDARVFRIDADSTRLKGSAGRLLTQYIAVKSIFRLARKWWQKGMILKPDTGRRLESR